MPRATPIPMLCLVGALLVGGCGPASPTSPASAAPASASSSPAAASASASPAAGSACTPATTPAAHDWNERTWYEVFVRSFADSDGDGIGDLKGLTAKLDTLNDGDPATTADLGIGGIWLMPVAQAASYHGYDVTDYEAIERDYGTRGDLEAFLAAAHQRGIKVIVDMVFNHTSIDHPWFKAARDPADPHHDWYVWSKSNPHWPPVAGPSPWHELDGAWYYGAFWEGMPDLNLRNDAVTAELRKVARFWLDLGVDGFRLDAAKHLVEDGPDAQTNTPETRAWLAGLKQTVDAANPDALLLGEVWDPPSLAAPYVPDSLDMTFDFGLATGVRLALQNGRAAPLRTALGETIDAWPANQEASFLSNHDQDRIMSQLNGDAASARLAAFLLFASPGVPFVYYGEELGMTGRKPDERIRTPMRWTADPATAGFTTGTPWEALSEDDAGTVNVEAQTADAGSLRTLYVDLVRLRSQHPALRDGATALLDADAEPVIAWTRTTADETLVAVVNTSDQPVSDYRLSLSDGPLCGPQAATLVGSVGGDAAATVATPVVTEAGGIDAWTPVATLAPRSGYLVRLEAAP